MWRAKSLAGLSPVSIYADVLLLGTNAIFEVLKPDPLRAYRKSVMGLVQAIIMVGLLWRYGTTDSDDDVVLGGESGGAVTRAARRTRS